MLRSPVAREALLDQVARIEQLVLLGDVIELRHSGLRAALATATPVLAEMAHGLPSGAQVVLVPGNHDHHLLEPWLRRRQGARGSPALEAETEVDWREDEPLALISDAVAPVPLRVAYPGRWLRHDVYATHGHFLDRHTTVPALEHLAAVATARIIGEPPRGPTSVAEYEATLAPVYAWIHAVVQGRVGRIDEAAAGPSGAAREALLSSERGRGLRRRALKGAFPLGVAALSRLGLGPLRADLSGQELRRAGLRAFGEVMARLRLDAAHVIFGHTHRAGPLPGDSRAEWCATTGAQLLNCGCWVHEPAFLGMRPEQSPYRAGFAVSVEDEGPPRLVNLLDGHRVTLRQAPAMAPALG